MSKKRIIRKSIAGVLALTMMVPTVLPSGEFVMDVLDSGIMRVAADSQQDAVKISNNGCPWFDFGMSTITYGNSMNFNIDFNQTAVSIIAYKSASENGTYSAIGNSVNVSASSISIPVTIEEGSWYKFVATFEDESVESTVPVTFITWNDYSYVSNGVMAYTLMDSSYFDVIGKNTITNSEWIRTSYGRKWEMETDYGIGIKALKGAFDINKKEKIDFQAELKENQTGFSIGCDVMIGKSDSAPVTAVRNQKGKVIQVQLVDTNGPLADITENMDSVVINTEKLAPSTYWIGEYYNREHFKKYVPVIDDSQSNYSLDDNGTCYQVQNLDSGLTTSWSNQPAGSTVPFTFLIGAVSLTGARNSAECNTEITSKRITVKSGVTSNRYLLQKKDPSDGTLTDIKFIYNPETRSFIPSDEGKTLIHPDSDGDFYLDGLIPETDYVLTVYTGEDIADMEDGKTVEPTVIETKTLIDPYETSDKDKPVKWSVTNDSVKIENLRDGYLYALYDLTDYIAPVNGVVEFTNLKPGTKYKLVAGSVEDEEIGSDSILIETDPEVVFIDDVKNYKKTIYPKKGKKLSDYDISDIKTYGEDDSENIYNFKGWFDDKYAEYDSEAEIDSNKYYKANYILPISKLENNSESLAGSKIDFSVADLYNDSEDEKECVVLEFNDQYFDIVYPEECADLYDELIYIGEKDGKLYFSHASESDNEIFMLLNKQSSYYSQIASNLPDEVKEMINEGKTIIVPEIEFKYSNIGVYVFGDNIVIYLRDPEEENDISQMMKEACDWSYESESDKTVISGAEIPFDVIMSMNALSYCENGTVVRESDTSNYAQYKMTWIELDDLYENEMTLEKNYLISVCDEKEDLIKLISAEINAAVSAEDLEEINSRYIDNEMFVGWYSDYEDEIIDLSKPIEHSDILYPMFGISGSKFKDNTIGKTYAKRQNMYMYNDTDNDIEIYIDKDRIKLNPDESYYYNFSDYGDSNAPQEFFFAGESNDVYCFSSLYPESYLEELYVEYGDSKLIKVSDDKISDIAGIIGVGDSCVRVFDYDDDDYKDVYFNYPNKTWSLKFTYSDSGIIERTGYPFDGLATNYQTCIIYNNEVKEDQTCVYDESTEKYYIVFDQNTPDPIYYRKVSTGLDISQIDGITSITIGDNDYNPDQFDGIIPIDPADKIIIYSQEEIEFDDTFNVSSTQIKTGENAGYKYEITVDSGIFDPDTTYFAVHKHEYSYITDTKDSFDATLRYKCNSERNSVYLAIAKLGIDNTLYYGDSLVPDVELLPENLNFGEKLDKGSVTYKSGNKVTSSEPLDFGTYNVAVEIILTNQDDSITKYSLSKNVNYQKRPLSECNVVVSPITYDGTAKIPTVKVINPSNGEELKLNTDYTIEPITEQTAVGTYIDGIKLHAVETSEYYTGDRAVSWSINKADLPGFSIKALDKYTYGSDLTIGVNELPEDALDGKVTYMYSIDKEDWYDEIPVDSGRYYVKAFFTDSASYNDTETAPFKFTIEKKKILITPVAAEMTYGDIMPLITCTLSDTVDEKPEPTQEQLAELVTVKGFSEDGSVRNTSNNAGKYQIVLSNKAKNPELKNYEFTFDNSNPVYLTVKPREISVDMFRLYSEDFIGDEYHFEYDGTRKNVSYYVNTSDTDGNYYVEDTYAVLKPDDFEQGGTVYATKAGAYKVEFIGNNELYGKGNWCGFKTLEWNISARDINVKIQAANGAEADKEYDGTPVAFEIVSTDPEKTLSSKAKVVYKYYKQNGTDTPDLLDAAPSDAGSYRVEAEVTEENSNVKVTGTDYVIRPKAATVNIDASTATKVYGDKTPEIKYTFEGIAASDEAEYAANTSGNVTADLTSENAGTYDLVADFADSNYSFTLSQTSFEVTPREIVEADVAISSSKVYIPDSGWTNPIVTVTSNGNTLTENTDYVLSGTFKTRIKGDKSFLVEGTGNYKGEVEVNWTAIAASDLSIMMTSAEPVYADGNYKVKYNFTMPELPEGLTVVKYGALYSKDGALDENASVTSGASKTEKKAERLDTYSLTINNKEKMENKTSAKCYLVVEDKEGKEYEIYSDTATYSYRDASLGCCGNITAEENTIVKENGQYKIVYTFDLNVPEGFTVKEYGALYNKDGIIASDLTYETAANKTTSSGNADLNKYTLKINEKDNPDKVSSARCYARVTDGKNEYMIYSNVVSDSFRSAAQREAEKNCSMKCDVSNEVKALTVTNPYKAIFKYTLNAGEGYTVISRGALYDKTVKLADHTTLESNASRVEKDGSGTYTLTMGYDAPEKAKGSAIGFMKVVDSYGLEHIIYSENQSCLSFTVN